MKFALLVAVTVLVLAFGTPARAHHAYAGTYVLEQNTAIAGTIIQMALRNPHSFLNIEVKDADGKITRWGVEWGGITELTQDGITATTFKAGDKIEVVGAPSRGGTEHKLLMRKIVRPADGLSWGDQPRQVLKNSTPKAAAPAAQ